MSLLRKHLSGLLMGLIASMLIAGGLSLCAAEAICAGAVPQETVLLYVLAGVLLPFVSGIMKKGKWIPAAALILLEAVLFCFSKGMAFRSFQAAQAVFLSLRGASSLMLLYARDLSAVIAFVLGWLTAVLVRDEMNGSLVPVCLGLLVLTGYLVNNEDARLFAYALPVFAGMMLTLAAPGGSGRWFALPVICLLIGLAAVIAPQDTTVEPLKEHAQTVKETIDDYFMYTGERQTFSLYSQGYLPLQERLGGTATPSDTPVLTVTGGTGKVYLRAVAYDTYNGRNWYDTLAQNRYLYQDLRYRAQRSEIFDTELPLAGKKASSGVTVSLLTRAATTLFAPQRFEQIDLLGRRMVLYFNDGSELFLTRDLEAGDSYRFEYEAYSAGDAATEQLIQACSSLEDAHYSKIAEAYCKLPSHLLSDEAEYVRELAHEAAGNAQTPYEAAKNIAAWLKSHYAYSLSVSDPPEDYDFLAYFLVTEKQGYCTYFATAMTLFCRMQGIPARYVTGFVAKTSGEESVTLTGYDAHAWTEIYLNGFGWLTMDATPGDEPEDQKDPGEDKNNTPPDGATPSPSPTPAPTPTPTPAPSEEPEVTPTPSPTAENTLTPQPTSTPSDPPKEPPQEDDKTDSSFPWWLLLLIAVIGLTGWRLLWVSPKRCSRRHPEKAAAVWERELFLSLHVLGMHRKKQETLREFIGRAEKALMLASGTLAAAGTQLEKARYSRMKPRANVLCAACESLNRRMKPLQRVGLAVRRAGVDGHKQPK